MKDPEGDRPTELVSRWVAIVGGALSLLVAVLSLSLGVTRDRPDSAMALTVAAFLTFGVVSAYLLRSRPFRRRTALSEVAAGASTWAGLR